MGANSTQGLAVLTFLVAFTLAGGAMAAGGNVLLFLFALAAAAVSIGLFLKAKPWEDIDVDR